MCAQQKTIPESTRIAVVDTTSSTPIYHRDFPDVFRAEHGGRPVAIKPLRFHYKSSFEALVSVSASVSVFQSDVCS